MAHGCKSKLQNDGATSVIHLRMGFHHYFKLLGVRIQWKLSITRSMGPRKFALYIRYVVISVANKQYKTKEINSLGPEKLVCYIRYFVISDLFISSFHCIDFFKS